MAILERATESVQDSILDKLHREGGALSPSELVLSTQMPYDLVTSVVDRLEEQGKVERVDSDGMSVVRLRKR